MDNFHEKQRLFSAVFKHGKKGESMKLNINTESGGGQIIEQLRYQRDDIKVPFHKAKLAEINLVNQKLPSLTQKLTIADTLYSQLIRNAPLTSEIKVNLDLLCSVFFQMGSLTTEINENIESIEPLYELNKTKNSQARGPKVKSENRQKLIDLLYDMMQTIEANTSNKQPTAHTLNNAISTFINTVKQDVANEAKVNTILKRYRKERGIILRNKPLAQQMRASEVIDILKENFPKKCTSLRLS